jgi:hypothetical protein
MRRGGRADANPDTMFPRPPGAMDAIGLIRNQILNPPTVVLRSLHLEFGNSKKPNSKPTYSRTVQSPFRIWKLPSLRFKRDSAGLEFGKSLLCVSNEILHEIEVLFVGNLQVEHGLVLFLLNRLRLAKCTVSALCHSCHGEQRATSLLRTSERKCLFFCCKKISKK